jgi:hypothetical protein
VSNYQIVNGFVSPMLGPNPFSFVYASGSLLRQYVNPSVIAAATNPAWIPLASALNSKYFSTGADATSAQPKCVTRPSSAFVVHALTRSLRALRHRTKVNMDTLIAAIIMFVFTVFMAFLNGDCGPGIKKPEALRKVIAAPPMNPEEPPVSDEFDANGKGEPSLRSVMIELREVKTLLQGRAALGGMEENNPFARLKMPTWKLGGETQQEPAAAEATKSGSVVGGSLPERGRKPVAETSTSNMQQQQGGLICLPGLFVQQPPQPPELRKSRSRSKSRNKDRDDGARSYYSAR